MSQDKKDAIKQKLDKTRETLLTLVSGLTEKEWQALAFSEESDWRVIDIIRHVADSERGMTNLMMQIKQGGEGVPPDFDLDRWNRRAVSKLQEKTPQELLAGMSESRAVLMSFIETLEPDDWAKKGRHASLRIMSIEEICNLIADHEEMHGAGIRQALAL